MEVTVTCLKCRTRWSVSLDGPILEEYFICPKCKKKDKETKMETKYPGQSKMTTEWETTYNELKEAGYREAGTLDPIDLGVCHSIRCPQCGHLGLDYHPIRKPGAYRAFAVCPECGKVTEF